MKNSIAFIFSVVFFFYLSDAFAQDLIVKNDGSKIYCQIVEVDSASIFYFRAAQKNKSVISRAEVKTYYATNEPNKKGRVPLDSVSDPNELFIIKLNGGVANAVGVFGSKDIDFDGAGLANTGYLLNASVGLKFNKNFGFIGCFRYQKNKVDNVILQQSYLSNNSPGVVFTVNATHWLCHGFLGGVFFDAPIAGKKNLSLDFTFLGGLPTFESPEINVDINSYGSTSKVLQNAGKTSAPAFEAKMGLRYKFKKVALNFGLSYFTAKPNFNGVLILNSNGYIDYVKFQQRISSFNVEAGLSFLIFK